MYDDIMNLYGQEMLHENGLRLTQIAQSDSHETKALATLADKTYRNSRTMRIAALVAMFCLPANLVMSFFRTTLVWRESGGEASSSECNAVLRIPRETWIAALATLMLMPCTLVAAW
ncbi:hypothetical protein DL765_010977 [Monosporascus sp. GIB2]|nr:hypothetical protein DL765_010977 [Monosporascus sp. GIB2]